MDQNGTNPEIYVQIKVKFINTLNDDWILIPFILSAVLGIASIVIFAIILICKCCKRCCNNIEKGQTENKSCTINIELDSFDQKGKSDTKNLNEYESPENLVPIRNAGRKRSLVNRCSIFIAQAQAYPAKFMNRRLPEIPKAFSNRTYSGEDFIDKGPQKPPTVIKPSHPYNNPKLSPFDMEKLQSTPKGYIIMNKIEFPSRTAPKLNPKPTMPVRPFAAQEPAGSSSRQFRRQWISRLVNQK